MYFSYFQTEFTYKKSYSMAFITIYFYSMNNTLYIVSLEFRFSDGHGKLILDHFVLDY